MRENEISRAILDAAIEVHRTLGGPGLLESVYEEALAHELRLRGHKVARLLSLRVALVINFVEHLVKDGIHRVINSP